MLIGFLTWWEDGFRASRNGPTTTWPPLLSRQNESIGSTGLQRCTNNKPRLVVKDWWNLVGKLFSLIVFLAPIVVTSPQAQQARAKDRVLITCTESNKVIQKKVDLVDFQRSHCAPNLDYFRALDATSNVEYVKIRTTLKWDVKLTIAYKGGVKSGNETFKLAPGVEVVRTYGASAMVVTIQNERKSAIFVEGYELADHSPLDTSTIAYIAVSSQASRLIYKVESDAAEQVWSSGEMQFSLLGE